MLRFQNQKELIKLLGGKPATSKYRNKKVDGFDSMGERDRYNELKLLESAGKIQKLERQVAFQLIVNDILICKYVADFRYVENGSVTIEDFKGVLTKEYIIKRKLMLACHGITIRETTKKKRR